MPKYTDQEIFNELISRWKTPNHQLNASQQRPQTINGLPAWHVNCPKCQKVGSRMGIGDKGGYVLLCPNCKKCYPLGQLVKEFASDLHFVDWTHNTIPDFVYIAMNIHLLLDFVLKVLERIDMIIG